MAETFRALWIDKSSGDHQASLTEKSVDDLMAGDVLVRVEYSTVNFKDGLAITNAFPIVRQYPMVGGIDLAGTVISSDSDQFKAGQRVLVNGYGLSEDHFGGYAGMARLKSEWLVPIPEAFTAAQAMAIGTAGYTSMLCVLALEQNGMTPDDGPILVTGAAGGVGSVAVSLLAGLGFHVIAGTGRDSEADYLKSLGAKEILPRAELEGDTRPLDKERWAGAVDVAGGKVLANVISMTKYDGVVAACGVAAGIDLPSNVMPFILRDVTLAGCDSVMAPMPRRLAAWQRLARDLNISHLESMTEEVDLAQVIDLAPQILAGKVRGRIVVKVS